MPNFIIAYKGGKQIECPDERVSHMKKWQDWIANLGSAAVNPGTPLGKSRIVSSQGVSEDGGPEALTGYTIVEADNMDMALAIAKDCPYLDIGSVEVAEIMKMG